MTIQELLNKQNTLKTLTLKQVQLSKDISKLDTELKQVVKETDTLKQELQTLFPNQKDLFEYIIDFDADTETTTEPTTTTTKKQRTLKFIHHFTFRKYLDKPLSRDDLFNNMKTDNPTLSRDYFDASVNNYLTKKTLSEKGGKVSWVK